MRVLFPQYVARSVDQMQYASVMDACRVLSQSLHQRSVVAGSAVRHLIHGVPVVALYAHKERESQYAPAALLDVSHRLWRVDACRLQQFGILEGTPPLGLAQAKRIDERVGESRLMVAFNVKH